MILRTSPFVGVAGGGVVSPCAARSMVRAWARVSISITRGNGGADAPFIGSFVLLYKVLAVEQKYYARERREEKGEMAVDSECEVKFYFFALIPSNEDVFGGMIGEIGDIGRKGRCADILL